MLIVREWYIQSLHAIKSSSVRFNQPSHIAVTLCTFANQQQIARPDRAGKIRDGRQAAFTAIHIGKQLLPAVTGIAAHSLAAGGVKAGKDLMAILLCDIVDSGKLHFTSRREHDGLDASSPGIHLKSHRRHHVVRYGVYQKIFPECPAAPAHTR